MLYINDREVSEYFSDSNCVGRFNVLSHDIFAAMCLSHKVTPNLLLYTHFLEALYLYLLANNSWNAGRKRYTYSDVKNRVHCKEETYKATWHSVGICTEETENWDDYINSHSIVMQTAIDNIYAAYCKKRQAVDTSIPDLAVYYRVLMAEILNLLPMNITNLHCSILLIRKLCIFCFNNSPLSRLCIKEADEFWSDKNYSVLPLLSIKQKS